MDHTFIKLDTIMTHPQNISVIITVVP